MAVYTWYRSPNRVLVDRLGELFNKAADWGGAYPVRARVDDLDEETDPPLYGFPVGAGPTAGTNPGAELFQTVRESIEANTNTHLSAPERLEILDYFPQEEPAITDDWFWNPSSPDYWLNLPVPP